jgi:cytochrome c biogenesis protein CcmG, thiol:disulfide interchange protein DsbE
MRPDQVPKTQLQPVASCPPVSRHVRSAALPAIALLALAVTGCGGGQPRSAAPSKGQETAAFKGSPPALAALHTQADRLLSGGTGAFTARLSSLRGHPVVVNKWASWCGPCQTEFPAFQRASLHLGRQVAFLGIDGKDHDAAASAFLRRFPVTYPSYVDPEESIARSIQAATYYPQTIFYDRRGKNVYDHAGPYLSASALEQDIRRYALR